MATKCSIHWFRKGLRLHDNPALLAACEGVTQLRPIFILDPWFVKNARVGINRWRFLIQTLQNLDENLRKVNSRLYVIKGKPAEVFPKLFTEWNVTKLTFEVDTEPYAKQRDVEVEALAEKHGVEVIKKVSNTLYDTDETIKKNGGTCPLTYQRCLTILSKMGPVPKPVNALTPDHLENCKGDKEEGNEYTVPSLRDLGHDLSSLGPELYPGGETEALRRMEEYLKKTNWICSFEKPQTSPNSIEPSTTVLSPYIKFGSLSPRLFYWKLHAVYSGKKHSQPPVSLHGQLLWREFFYTAGDGTPNFDKMVGNPVCRQIPWDDNKEYLEAWAHARTGYPHIDAIMTQLRTEGWIHHLARHSVACFLTRGDLWISWEEGMKVFEELLLDGDWSLNAGNWMWLSASAFFHQYFRVYSPIAFGKKTDKGGVYIKKYIPKLKKFPEKYIYEPWTAPLSVQQAAGCIIGKDYPKPIVQHDKISKINVKRMAEAYAQHKAEKEGSQTENGTGKRKAKDGEESAKKKKKKGSSSKKITDFLK